MTEVTWWNMDHVPVGSTIYYANGRYGVLKTDRRYNGGLCVDGMSLHYLLDNYDSVYFSE